MIRGLQSKTLTRLRDHLLVTGERKSLFLAGAQAYEHPLEGDDEAKAYFDAVAEAMYLMIASDGKLEESERHVLRGALRDLTANQMHTAAIEKLVGEFDAALKEQGQPARVAAVCEVLKERQEAAEAAFVLAAAVAFADDEIADSENDMLNALAEQLNISSARAEELLDELEQDSAELPTSGFSFGCFCLLT
jgi:tellurite resistance protein